MNTEDVQHALTQIIIAQLKRGETFLFNNEVVAVGSTTRCAHFEKKLVKEALRIDGGMVGVDQGDALRLLSAGYQ